MKASINPYMAPYTEHLDGLETAAKRQRVRPFGEPRRSGSGDWALSLAVAAVAIALVAVTLPRLI